MPCAAASVLDALVRSDRMAANTASREQVGKESAGVAVVGVGVVVMGTIVVVVVGVDTKSAGVAVMGVGVVVVVGVGWQSLRPCAMPAMRQSGLLYVTAGNVVAGNSSFVHEYG